MTKPTTPPRMMGMIERFHSSIVSHSLPCSLMISGRMPLVISSIAKNTSAMAKSPTTTTMNPTPSCNSGTPIV